MMTVDELQQRIERLERQHRRARAGMFLVFILAACAVVAMAQAQSVFPPGLGDIIPQRGIPSLQPQPEPEIQPEIRTTTLSLYGTDGKPRGVLSALGDGSALALFDRNGKTRVELSSSGNNVALTLYDGDGKVRAVLGSTNLAGSRVPGERSPASSLVLMDGTGKLVARMPQ